MMRLQLQQRHGDEGPGGGNPRRGVRYTPTTRPCRPSCRRSHRHVVVRWLSRDPIGESGGSNLYGLVRNNPILDVDILGLAAIWTFSGVNSWDKNPPPTRGNDYQDYVQQSLPFPFAQSVSASFVSRAGWLRPNYYNPFNDSRFIATPWSQRTLDDEAQEVASNRVNAGDLCCKRIAVLMVAPKTHTRPTRDGCCKIADVQVYRNPLDPVPNQGLSSSRETDTPPHRMPSVPAQNPAR